MLNGMENHVALGSLLDAVQSISEAVDAAREVLIQKDNFKIFSAFLERAAFFLRELSKSEVKNLESLKEALENLKAEIKVAERLASECTKKNKIYLLLSCMRIVEDLEKNTTNISRAMIPFTIGIFDESPETNDELIKLCNNMAYTQYHVSVVEEEILREIETGMEDKNIDRSHASNLLIRIAKSIGISSEQSELKKEFENFKNEMEGIESRTEASRMERIIELLGDADMVTTPKEKIIKYFTKRNSLGRQLLEPLQSFFCPITGDVMADPVETTSAQTFERAAIEKWLAEGNNLCPLTKTPLSKSALRPNKVLRQSIEEWRNRNIMISIASLKPEIQSGDEQEVLHALKRLHDLCGRSEIHREWIVMEDYIPIIRGLLSAKTSELRVLSLAILYYLAKDGDNNKEKIAEENDSITYIVRSLARKVDESLLALQLLSELSRNTNIRGLIGNAQGCILLLVTLANNDDPRASECAQEVLDNLAFLDQNVIQMARAKFFKPLLQRLCDGDVGMQVIMADTLADVELTDHNKLCLSRDGALKPLLQMLRHSDIEVRAAAVRALQNLSGVAANGLELIKHGAKTPLFELLFSHSLPSPSVREIAARTFMHLAISTTCLEASGEQISLLETEDDIFKLFSLISYSGPDMQETLLLTFIAMCKSPFGFEIRKELRQISAVKVLVHLCELDDLAVRANAVKLFHHLTEDGDHPTFSEQVNKTFTTTLVKIIKTSNNKEEASAAMGIVSNLPHNFHMSQQLLDSGAFEAIFNCLTFRNTHSSHEKALLENATSGLCRFTIPSNPEWQKLVAQAGTIPLLVNLLSSATPPTKQNAAISLKNFSESSSNLSLPVKTSRFMGCCFASPDNICPVHAGICGIESSFCLLEANALGPLVVVLGEPDANACEACLDVILTLIDGVRLQNGCKVIDEAGALLPMIKLLNSSSNNLQEKTLGALLRIFRLVEYKVKYGKSAQMSLVDITQRGSSNAKSLAAKILAQLNVLNEQSSFFDGYV